MAAAAFLAYGIPPHYKLDFCWNFQRGDCRLGDQCSWAHSVEELWRWEANWQQQHVALQTPRGEVIEEEPVPPPNNELTPYSARNVLLGEKVAEKLKSLNSGTLLQSKIDINTVVGPLSKLDTETVLDILEDLLLRSHSIDDPTAWICEAAEAIPQPQSLNLEEAEDLPAEPPRKRRKREKAADDAEDGDEDDDGEEEEEEEEEPQEGKAASAEEKPAPEATTEQTKLQEPQGPQQPQLPQQPQQPQLPQQPQPQPAMWRPPPPVQPAAPSAQAAVQGEVPTEMLVQQYKADLCRRWLAGSCPYGLYCNWAHGHDELRLPPQARPVPRPAVRAATAPSPHVVATAPNLNRTTACLQFPRGHFPSGEASGHAQDEIQSRQRLARLQLALRSKILAEELERPVGKELTLDQICLYKTRLCVKFALGKCTLGGDCLLAHGPSDLRQPWKVPIDDEPKPADEASAPAPAAANARKE